MLSSVGNAELQVWLGDFENHINFAFDYRNSSILVSLRSPDRTKFEHDFETRAVRLANARSTPVDNPPALANTVSKVPSSCPV